MDTAIRIPGIGFRIGLDPIIGLVPGAGDLISTAFSAYIIAARFRLPREVLLRMIFNIGLEAVVGSVPLVVTCSHTTNLIFVTWHYWSNIFRWLNQKLLKLPH